MKKLLFMGCLALFFGSCSKSGEKPNPTPTPPPEQPKPTVQVVATPSPIVEHGDSVTISCNTTNASTVPPPVKFRPVRDTSVSRTVYGTGGEATGSLPITVTFPQDAVNITNGPWKIESIKYQQVSGNWQAWGLNHCDSVGRRTFYLNFRESNTCVPNAQADWYWKAGNTGKRDSLYWGGPVYQVYQLTATKMVLQQKVKDWIIPNVVTLVEWTYIH
jgi:hypothetical protein